jgi:guanine deaminase
MALLLKGGRVLNGTRTTLEPADVLVNNTRIVAVRPSLPVSRDVQEYDATGCIILPGLINAHTHSHNNLTRGLADNWTLEDLLNYGPVLYANRTPEEQYLSAAIGAIEMLKTGCTAAYDLFTSLPAPNQRAVEATISAYTDVGMRAVVSPLVADMVFYQTVPGLLELLPPDLKKTVAGIEAAPTKGLLDVVEDVVRRWDGAADGRIRVGVGPTIPGQCTDQLLTGCLRLAREYGVGIHTHLAETKIQVIYGMHRWGKSLVGQLGDLNLLGPGFVGAHGVWLTSGDIRQLADTGATVVHNPASNLKLGSGIAPVREMLSQEGLNVGLGADGSMSSDNQNMFEAMRFAALVNKVRYPYQPEHWIGAQAVWAMATTGSAQALGMVEDIGAVAPGYKADLVLLRADSVFLRPLNHPLNALVYAETGASVETVLVDGRIVLEEGRVLTLDEKRVYGRAQEAADQFHHERNVNARALADRLTPYLAAACRTAAAVPYPIERYAATADAEETRSKPTESSEGVKEVRR